MKQTANNIYILYPAKPKTMQSELKIIDSVICGSPWADAEPDGTLYKIQVGNDPQNIRVAFIQETIGQPVWVKKGYEEEAMKAANGNITTKPHLFDLKEVEPREALISLFSKEAKGCSRPHNKKSKEAFPRKACG